MGGSRRGEGARGFNSSMDPIKSSSDRDRRVPILQKIVYMVLHTFKVYHDVPLLTQTNIKAYTIGCHKYLNVRHISINKLIEFDHYITLIILILTSRNIIVSPTQS